MSGRQIFKRAEKAIEDLAADKTAPQRDVLGELAALRDGLDGKIAQLRRELEIPGTLRKLRPGELSVWCPQCQATRDNVGLKTAIVRGTCPKCGTALVVAAVH